MSAEEIEKLEATRMWDVNNPNIVTTGSQRANCPYCGSCWHSGMCPRIEAIEYHPNGAVKSIKLRDVVQPTVTNVTVNPLLVPAENPNETSDDG